MFEKLLVPVDGSVECERGIPFAAVLARGLGVPTILLGVHAPAPGKAVETRVLLDRLAERLHAAGVQTELVQAAGEPAEEILRAAAQHSCDLVALFTPAPDESGKASLPGPAAEVLRNCPVPIIVVPGNGPLTLPATVFVGLDGSSLAETSLPYLEELARRLSISLTLVRAQKPVLVYGSTMNGYPPMPELEEAAELETTGYLEEVADRLRASGCSVRWQALDGPPALSIPRLAAETPRAMVALTTHGRSGISRWILGSVTEEVIRASVAPVLVVPQRYSQQYAQSVTSMLGSAPVFAGLPEADRQSLARISRIREFAPGETIIAEGEVPAGCFVIANGEVEITHRSPVSGPVSISTAAAGDLFGEMSVMGSEPSCYSARALVPTRCVCILRTDFMAEMQRHPEIAVSLLPVLVRRTEEAMAAAAR